MITSTRVSQGSQLPILIVVPASLLLVDGVLALLGCITYPGNVSGRVLDAIGSAILVLTGVSVLTSRKSAIYLACLSAMLLTVDQFRQFTAFDWSLQTTNKVGHFLLNVVAYWILFGLYRRWRHNSSETGNANEPNSGRMPNLSIEQPSRSEKRP